MNSKMIMIWMKKIIYKSLWMLLFSLVLMFSFELEIYFLLYTLFLIFMISGFIILLMDFNSWISMMILIFLIGGLMISFFYMVSLSHNSMFNMKTGFLPLILFFSYYYKHDLLIMSCLCLPGYWLMKNLYMIFVILVLIFMILVLIFIDQKLKSLSGNLKEF